MREEMRCAAVAAGHGIRAASTAFAQSWWAVLAVALLTGLLLDQRWQATHPHLAQPLKRGEHLRAVLLEGLDHRARSHNLERRRSPYSFVRVQSVLRLVQTQYRGGEGTGSQFVA